MTFVAQTIAELRAHLEHGRVDAVQLSDGTARALLAKLDRAEADLVALQRDAEDGARIRTALEEQARDLEARLTEVERERDGAKARLATIGAHRSTFMGLLERAQQRLDDADRPHKIDAARDDIAAIRAVLGEVSR